MSERHKGAGYWCLLRGTKEHYLYSSLSFVLWNSLTGQGSKSLSDMHTGAHIMHWQIVNGRVHWNQLCVLYVCQVHFPACECMYAFAGFVDMDYNCIILGEHTVRVAWSSDMLAHNHKLLKCPWVRCLTPKLLQRGFPQDNRGDFGSKQSYILVNSHLIYFSSMKWLF